MLAIALVATALSAPTWTKQLSMLSTTTDSCACDGCVNPFWESGLTITKADCIAKCNDNSHGISRHPNAPAASNGYHNQTIYLTQGAGVVGTAQGSSAISCKFALYDAEQTVNCHPLQSNSTHTFNATNNGCTHYNGQSTVGKCWLYDHVPTGNAGGASKYSW